MEPRIKVLSITAGSDGDGRKWPKHHYERNDEYFKERIASDKWIHDLPGGPQPGLVYKLDKLPSGYAGFQRARPDSKHVDRYIYGHPNGQFRSLNEFYPHFKHLMDYGGPVGCTCKLCVNGSSRPKAKPSTAKATGSGYISEASGDQGLSRKSLEPVNLIPPFKPGSRPNEEQWQPQKRKLNDVEGVPDVYEDMIKRLKHAGPDESLDEPIMERMSPDWRVGNVSTKEHVDELMQLPRYVPRPGELVLFDDGLGDGQRIAWDNKGQGFTHQELSSGSWLEPARWKIGVVTQIPKEQISEQDLVTDVHKERAVNESGFRIQLLSKPGDEHKSFSKQLKYVPLHAIRPFYLWQDCLKSIPEKDWHPTVQHALTVASSFCVIGRFRFRGVWPNATVFARGVYLGPELILVGDTVRLTPRNNEQSMDSVTDVMVVTAIRLRFVNLNMEDDDLAPELPGLPYQTCLHFSGRVFTLDPTRSFDGVGKVPIDAETDILPAGIATYGQWYHYSDPERTSARTELPYTRILGRCVEGTAPATWFKNGINKSSLSSFQEKNSKGKAAVRDEGDKSELTRGLQATIEARAYSQRTDKRIRPQESRTWYWADTRVDQLDLYEVNQRDVGTRNRERTKGQMAKWKAALKAIDGKQGAVQNYKAVQSKRKEQVIGQSSYGMMRPPASSTEPEPERLDTSASPSAQGSGLDAAEDEVDAMDVDEEEMNSGRLAISQPVKPRPASRERMGASGSSTTSGSGGAGYETPPTVPPKHIESITLSDSEDEDHLANDQQVGELSKNMRRNDAQRNGRPHEVVELD